MFQTNVKITLCSPSSRVMSWSPRTTWNKNKFITITTINSRPSSLSSTARPSSPPSTAGHHDHPGNHHNHLHCHCQKKDQGLHLNLRGRSNAIVEVYNAACSSYNSGRTEGSTCGRKTKGDETLPHILGFILGVTHYTLNVQIWSPGVPTFSAALSKPIGRPYHWLISDWLTYW